MCRYSILDIDRACRCNILRTMPEELNCSAIETSSFLSRTVGADAMLVYDVAQVDPGRDNDDFAWTDPIDVFLT